MSRGRRPQEGPGSDERLLYLRGPADTLWLRASEDSVLHCLNICLSLSILVEGVILDLFSPCGTFLHPSSLQEDSIFAQYTPMSMSPASSFQRGKSSPTHPSELSPLSLDLPLLHVPCHLRSTSHSPLQDWSLLLPAAPLPCPRSILLV